MKTRIGIILSLSLGLLSANAAMANDAVLGAIVGGGLGAAVGSHVGGRDGAVIGSAVGAAAGVVIASDDGHRHRPAAYGYAPPPPVRVYAPGPVYAPAPVYAPTPVYYAPPPVRIVRPPVVYVPVSPARGEWRHDHRHYEREHYDRHWR